MPLNSTKASCPFSRSPGVLITLLMLLSTYGCEKLDYRLIESDGEQRRYAIYIPTGYDQTIPAPLVFDFHSTASSPAKQSAVSRLNGFADREGFIVVRPEGQYKLNALTSWNADLDPLGVDDVQFVIDILDDVESQYLIDKSRIYAVGFSGGARMVSRLACELPDVFTAMAMVAGIQYPVNCNSSESVSILAFHGEQDTVNPYDSTSTSPEYWVWGVEESIAGWAEHNQCIESVVTWGDTFSTMEYNGCIAGSRVELFRFPDSGHTWPGNPITTWLGLGETNTEVNATSVLWQFFQDSP